MITYLIRSQPRRQHLSIQTLPNGHTAISTVRLEAVSALQQVEKVNVAREVEKLQYESTTPKRAEDVDTASLYMDAFINKGGTAAILQVSGCTVEEF